MLYFYSNADSSTNTIEESDYVKLWTALKSLFDRLSYSYVFARHESAHIRSSLLQNKGKGCNAHKCLTGWQLGLKIAYILTQFLRDSEDCLLQCACHYWTYHGGLIDGNFIQRRPCCTIFYFPLKVEALLHIPRCVCLCLRKPVEVCVYVCCEEETGFWGGPIWFISLTGRIWKVEERKWNFV